MKDLSILKIVLICLLALNIVTFLIYGLDKFKAQHARWRVPESVLLGLAVIGGSIGAWLGMMVWRHKPSTRYSNTGFP